MTGFYTWLAWYLGVAAYKTYGPRNPDVRPPVPRLIPVTWWAKLRVWLAARAATQGPWHTGRGLYVAWGLPDDSTLAAEADLLARMCATPAKDGKSKFSWVALEATPENLPKAATVQAACERHGVRYGVWKQSDDTPAKTVSDFAATFYIANREGPTQGTPVVLSVPRAVCTNFGGLEDAAAAKPWIAAGYDCQPEAYVVDNPQATVAAQTFEALQRGWVRAFPVVGVYHDFPLVRYGAGWSAVYLREGMQPADWDF